MIKSKPCKRPGCKNPACSHGYCWNDQHLRTDATYLRKQEEKKSKPKKVYVIPKTSKKYASKLAKYSLLAKESKEEKPFCEWPGCNKAAEHTHHSKGRGIYLLDKSTFISLCEEHHRRCKESPEEAMRLEMIFSRIISEKKYS